MHCKTIGVPMEDVVLMEGYPKYKRPKTPQQYSLHGKGFERSALTAS